MPHTRSSSDLPPTPILLVGCLFLLAMTATQVWRVSERPSCTSQPAVADSNQPPWQRYGAEIRAEVVLARRQHRPETAPAPEPISALAFIEPSVPDVPLDVDQSLDEPEMHRPSLREDSGQLADSWIHSAGVRSPNLSRLLREVEIRYENLAGMATPKRQVTSPQLPPPGTTRARPASAPEQQSPWPAMPALESALGEFNSPHAAIWAQRVLRDLDALQTAESLADPIIFRTLGELRRRLGEAEPLAASSAEANEASRLRRSAYAIRRRWDAWVAVHQAAQPGVSQSAARMVDRFDRTEMLARLTSLRGLLSRHRHGELWGKYLYVRELEQLAVSPNVHDPQIRAEAATRVLARMHADGLDEMQRKFLGLTTLQDLEKELRKWSTYEVDLADLLVNLETFEGQPSATASQPLIETWSRLRFSAVPQHVKLATAIDQHYRNANVRLSVTEEFLNRLIPAVRNASAPVREIILGAQVQGQSQSQMRLSVDVLPDDERIRLLLRGNGRMASKTQSNARGVTLLNRNDSQFYIEKLFVFDSEGLRVGRSNARASGDTNLIGLRTQFDSLPLLGSLVRRIAKQKHLESKPQTRRIFENLVAVRTSEQIDARASQQIAEAQQRVQERVINRLKSLQLDPATVSTMATNERLTYRGRLAGEHQLAAYTARPWAPKDNLLSLQLHESAINNLVAQLGLDGRKGNLKELLAEAAARLGRTEIKFPEEMPDDVLVKFADHDAVHVRCDQDRLDLTLNFAGLRFEGHGWKNFAVRASYVPQCQGFQCELHREDSIRLLGNRRRQFALRAVFTKVLSKNRPIKLINTELSNDERLADLHINQFVAKDGWLGVAFARQGKPSAHRMAQQPPRRGGRPAPRQ